MRSNVCKIEKGTRDLAAILKECEKVAVYNELDKKQTMHLRLLCEELDGMLPELVGDFDGELYIELVDGLCRINVSIELNELSTKKKEQLISIAKNRKNAAAVGIVGRIRSVIEDVMLDAKLADSMTMTSATFAASTGYSEMMDYTYAWSLEKYMGAIKSNKEKNAKEWDELERSVIATVADDVVVGVKGHCADIIITKKFA